jgi:Transcriptional regulator, AbiEi antitoxin
MNGIHGLVLALAEGQCGLVRAKQLVDLGLTKDAIRNLVVRGLLDHVHKGVYRVGTGEMTSDQKLIAACLTAPHAVGSHGTAAALLGLRRAPRDRIEMTIGHEDRLSVPGVLAHRSNRIDPDDIVYRLNGARITTPERTLFDMASVLDPYELRSMAQDAINRELTNALSLAEIDRRLGGQGRPGARSFHDLVAWLGVELPPVESDGELRLFEALERAGVNPVRQHWVELRNGSRIRFDIALPPVRVGLEHDHSFWHSNPGRVVYDKWRDVHARWVWWETHRFTDVSVRNDLREIVAFVKFLYADLTRQSTFREPFAF